MREPNERNVPSSISPSSLEAEKEGVAPLSICDKYAAAFQAMNARMYVSNDHFVRTTHAAHQECSRELWRRCAARGDIYLDQYKGWCVGRTNERTTDDH